MNLRTIPQVAKTLKVSDRTIERHARKKNLLTVKIGNAWVLTPGAVMIIRHAIRTAGKGVKL